MKHLLATIVILVSTRTAHAGIDTDWRDGCPAGNMQTAGDVSYASSDDTPKYRGTNVRRTGAAPDLDSALIPSRFGLAGFYAHLSSSASGAGVPAYLAGWIAHAHQNVDFSETDERIWSFGASEMLAGMEITENSTTAFQLGNFVFAPSLRRHWTTTGTDVEKSAPDRFDSSVIDPVGLRHAIAFQGLIAGRYQWGTGPGEADQDFRLLQRTAFDGYLIAPRETLGLAFETRSEGVGCYAPFVHLRLSILGTHDTAGKLMALAPQTLAVGFYASSHFAIMFQYGLLLYEATNREHRALLDTNAIHRFRIGGEWTSQDWSFAAHFDLFRGSTLYDGTVFGFSVSHGIGAGE
jgi:hypothetical protein